MTSEYSFLTSGDVKFSEDHFRAAEKHAAAVRAFFRELAASVRPRLEDLRANLPRLGARLESDEALKVWVNATASEKTMNFYGPGLGAEPPPAIERFLHILLLGRVLSPSIETLAARAVEPPPPPPADTPHVSIIILAWNGWEDTRECLGSIFSMTRHPSFEVIVVDNASTDVTKDALPLLAEKFPGLRVIRSETNLGFSGGNNLGAEHARGKHLLFLNNDIVVLERSWLRRMVETLESDEKTGAVGQMGVVDMAGEIPEPAFFQLVFFPGIATPVAWISGYCLLMRREAFAAAERWRGDLYGLGGFEDIHMGYALRRAGWTSVIGPRWVPIFHKVKRTRMRDDAQEYLAAHDLEGAVKVRTFREQFGARRRCENYALGDAPAGGVEGAQAGSKPESP